MLDLTKQIIVTEASMKQLRLSWAAIREIQTRYETRGRMASPTGCVYSPGALFQCYASVEVSRYNLDWLIYE